MAGHGRVDHGMFKYKVLWERKPWYIILYYGKVEPQIELAKLILRARCEWNAW